MTVESPPISLATFWAGEDLSPLEAACLHSFVVHGHDVTLYRYRALSNVPPGIRQRDAAEILEHELMDAFVYDGKPNLSHFSDLFRYRLFRKTSQAWIDADLVMLQPITLSPAPTLVAREHQGTLCGAIMRFAPDDPILAELDDAAMALMHRGLRWGETGPLLLSRLLRKRGRADQAFDADLFFPFTHNDFWKVFLPEAADECTARCQGAYTIHLFNNVLTRLGIWKRLAPPTGSFLHARFVEDESLRFFDDVYPADVMRQMVENWQLRKNGGDLGIRGLLRQILPSIRRTARHYGFRSF